MDALTKRREELLERALDKSERLLEEFDAEAEVAFKTLKMIHRDVQEKGSTRIAAAVSILERASIAPRKRSDDATAAVTKVMISQVAMKRIQEALDDVGEGEMIDLAEGEWRVNGPIEPREAP